MYQMSISAWGRRSNEGWRGGIRLPHPRSGAMLALDLSVPREFAEDLARQFRRALHRAEVSGEVGFIQSILPIAAQALPAILPGLVQGAAQLLGGGRPSTPSPAPAPSPAPPPAPLPPPPAPAPAPARAPRVPTGVPPLPGLAGLLGAGGVAPDLLGATQVLAAAPRFSAWSPELGTVLRTAVRVIDAEAARRLGDPRARAALAEARRSVEERVIRALRLVDAMLQ